MNKCLVLLFTLFFSTQSYSEITVAGEYRQWVEKDLYSSLIVTQREANSVYLSMSCQRGGPSYNSGSIEKTLLALTNNTLRWHQVFIENDPCIIDINFTEMGAQVKQVSGYGAACGFGFHVMCDGLFIKH